MASVQVLRDKATRARSGDLSDAEDMLVAQMDTLHAMFCDFARRASLNTALLPDVADRYYKLAMKVQGQCRATIETLSVLKSPPTVFARQANIANGPQQVNNGVTSASESRARAETLETEK